jgi:hypothetical protein
MRRTLPSRAPPLQLPWPAGTTELLLAWKTIARDELGLKWRDAAYGERPRSDLRAFGEDGVWATLSAFTPDLVQRAIAEREKWRARKVIVLDVRGNTGGSSIWGYQLLAALLASRPRGRAAPVRRVAGVRGQTSSNVEATMAPLARTFYGPDSRVRRELRRIGSGMRAALAQGKPFYRHDVDFGSPEAAAEEVVAQAGALPEPAAAQVFLVTDGRCVSACLDFVDQALRYPHVTQVGLATDADSPYTELRPDIPLPSALATLSLAMTVYRRRPRTWKPFVPHDVFPGRIDDTAAVERWVASLASSAPAAGAPTP